MALALRQQTVHDFRKFVVQLRYGSNERRMTPVRTLIVEDFEPFRRCVGSMLKQRPELEVVAEVEDGLAAVQMATDLEPELILLDLGLPKLNGMEAARQIRDIAPEAKILFLSQESTPEVVQGALALGGRGYVLKAFAQRDLLAAIDTVLQGNVFVSNGNGNGLSASESVQVKRSDDNCNLNGLKRITQAPSRDPEDATSP
jgi:DNA-binding NarL/FixJ family response regulator